MEVMGSPAWIRLAEPVHLIYAIRRIQIFELGQWLETAP